MAPKQPSTIRAEDFTAYANASYERAVGKNIVSSQFQFNPGDLAYIAGNYHSRWTTSRYSRCRPGRPIISARARMLSTDLLYGTGLRRDGATPNGDHVPGYVTVNLGVSQDFSQMGWSGLTARFDVINLFDEIYEIRDGTGVGVGAPQFGARRGFFFGLSKAI